MIKNGFVILHYCSETLTRMCVESILVNDKSSPVVIVDNGSPDQSGSKIDEAFRYNSRVKVLLLNDNIGFSRGNNEGIKYIRHEYNVDFVTLLNNDTQLTGEGDFSTIVGLLFSKFHSACIGPEIIGSGGLTNSNPVEGVITKKSEVFGLIVKRCVKLLLAAMHLNALVHNSGEAIKIKEIFDNDQEYHDVKLHGACWILTPVFFQTVKQLDPRTFLYFEEDILFHQIRRSGGHTLYSPELKIFHKEDGSTDAITSNTRKKNMFVWSNEIRSLLILLKVI